MLTLVKCPHITQTCVSPPRENIMFVLLHVIDFHVATVFGIVEFSTVAFRLCDGSRMVALFLFLLIDDPPSRMRDPTSDRPCMYDP